VLLIGIAALVSAERPAEKTDIAVFGTNQQLQASSTIEDVEVAGSLLPVMLHIQSPGVTLDGNLRFDHHESAVVKSCVCHSYALCHLCKMLSEETAECIACSIIAVRLDYFNAPLHGAPGATISKLQHAQNALARFVIQSHHRTCSASLH
jgi:hypothetical protein